MSLEKNSEEGRDRSRDRFRGRGRGAFVHYYEDMGTSSTEEGHAKYVAGKKKFDALVAKQEGKLAAAQAEINKAQALYEQGEISYQQMLERYNKLANMPFPGVSTNFNMPSFDQAWNDNTVPVRVVSGNNIESTKRLPRESVNSFLASNPGVNAGWVDNGKNFNIEVNQGGRIRGKETHTFLNKEEARIRKEAEKRYAREVEAAQRAAEAAARAQFERERSAALDAGSKNLETARGQLADLSSKLSTAKVGVEVGRKEVEAAKTLRQRTLDNIKATHKEKEGIIREIFSNMDLDMGEYTFTDEGGIDLSFEQVQMLMEDRGLPQSVIMTDGKIDNEKVDMLTTFLIDQLIAEKEREGAAKDKTEKRKSSLEKAMEEDNATA